MSRPSENHPDIGRLTALVARLRAPDGCPWDREQTLAEVRTYLLEEAHEAAAAMDEGDLNGLAEELGDLLFQVVFACHLAAEQGAFDLTRVIRQVEEKMVARHPHVFGGETLPDARAVSRAWEERKRRERDGSVLAGLPASLPALVAATRLTQRAASLGFDWHSAQQVLGKLHEEIDELEATFPPTGKTDRDEAKAEIGDLIFTLVNLSRHLDVDAESATSAANRRFSRRFRHVETRLAEHDGEPTSEMMEQWWEEAKEKEATGEEGEEDR